MKINNYIQNIPRTNRRRVVVLGGGFAGLELTKRLCKSQNQVVLLDKNNYHQFQPLLYQVATSGLEPSAVSFPLRKFFQQYKHVHFRVAEVLSVDTKTKEVVTSVGRLTYDILVLAMGTETNFYGNVKMKKNALSMKSTADSIFIRNWILENFEKALNLDDPEIISGYINIALVGGGPTGVELAGALAEMKKYVFPKDYPGLDLSLMKINLYQGVSRLLPGMSPVSSAKAKKYLEKLGVEVHLQSRVIDYDGKNLQLADGRNFSSRNVIWTAGVTAVPIEGVDPVLNNTANRLIVNRHNLVEGYKDIYALGDLALMKTRKFPDGHPQVAQVALQQARTLACNLKKTGTAKPLVEFEYINRGMMATIGRNLAVADLPMIHLGGFWAWLVWSIVHLMTLVGGKNKVSTFLNWIWKYLTYDQSLRLIIKPKTHQAPQNL